MYEELRAVQLAELYILKEIKRICNKHDIKYFLTGGTMLGAVRHKGFIPWDDDIDIAMVKEEYERFLQIAPYELGAEFFLDNEKTNSEYGLVFSKVRLRGTKFVELKGNKYAKHNELFVDIFPYINLADDKKERTASGIRLSFLSQLLLIKAGYKVWRGDGVSVFIKFLPVRLCALFITKTELRKRIDRLANRYCSRTNYTCSHNGSKMGYLRWNLDRRIFDEYMEIEFEGDYYPIPKEYRKCLEIFYGKSYMELPPENKRITHRPMVLDLGKYEGEIK